MRRLEPDIFNINKIMGNFDSLSKIRQIILILLFICSGLISSFAQSSKTDKKLDSLLKVNEAYTKEDTVKTKLLKNIGNVYTDLSDYPKALEYDHKALSVNESLGNKEGIASNLNNIGVIYCYLSDNPKALEYFQKALSINEQIENKSQMALNFRNIGNVYADLSDNPNALMYYQKALNFQVRLGNKREMALDLNNIGNIYLQLSDNPKALEFYQKAESIQEALEDKMGMSITLLNIGILYSRLSDVAKGLEYKQKALILSEAMGDKIGVALALSGIGSNYLNLSDSACAKIGLSSADRYLKALVYFQKALDINEQIGNKREMIYNLNGIGDVYYNLSGPAFVKSGIARKYGYPKALEYYQKALAVNEQLGDKNYMVGSLFGIGNVYLEAPDSILREENIKPGERYTKVLEYYNRSLQIAKEIGNLTGQRDAWKNISITYEKQKDFGKAYDTYKNYIGIRDSITNEDTKKQITRKEIQYEYDKKEIELKSQKDISDEKLKQQLLIAKQKEQEIELNKKALTFASQQAEIQHLAYLKQQALLEKEKAEKNEKDKQLTVAEQEKQLQASSLQIVNKEKALQLAEINTSSLQRNLVTAISTIVVILLLFSLYTYKNQQVKKLIDIRNKISRDLHDDIGATLSSISLYSEAAQKFIDKNEPERAQDIINKIGNNSRTMIDDMGDIVWAVNATNDQLDNLIARLEAYGEGLFAAKETGFEIKADNSLKDVRLEMTKRKNLYFICKEALNNAAKYANSHQVALEFHKIDNYIVATITDDGQGFDTKIASNGNGLKNMRTRSKEMDAEVSITSTPGKGTQVKLKMSIT